MNIRLSRNLMKFVWVTIFCEKNPMVKSVLSSKIYKNYSFCNLYTSGNFMFNHFSENFKFTWVYITISLQKLVILLEYGSHLLWVPFPYCQEFKRSGVKVSGTFLFRPDPTSKFTFSSSFHNGGSWWCSSEEILPRGFSSKSISVRPTTMSVRS